MVKAAASVALAAATIAYPLVVFYGLEHWGLARVSAFVGVCAVVGVAVRLRRGKGLQREGRPSRLVTLLPPAIVMAAAGLGWMVQQPRLLLFMPVVINAALALTFAHSLRGPAPIIERYARLLHPDLSLAESQHCRQVTKVWCAFFVVNGGVAAALAAFAPLSWWAAYTGLGAYVAMGTLIAGEYVVRKRRFGRFGTTLPDRVLAHLLMTKGKP